MNRYWLPLQGVPWVYLVLAVRLARGLRHQPRIVHAWSPDRFAEAVHRAGGAAAVRRGLRVDGVFIALFASTTVPALRVTGGPWGVPVAAAGLDTLEGFILASLLPGQPRTWQTRLLAVLATGKLGAYAVATGLAVAAAWKLRN